MSSIEEFVKNASNIGVLRKILFAAIHLPQDMPNYWETINRPAHHGGRLKFTLMCTFLVKAESGGYQTWIYG